MKIIFFFDNINYVMEKNKNILAINFGGIGDEIFFLPALISLKKEFPDSKITLALEPRSKSVKDLTDIIDDMFLIDIKGKNKYLELLKLVSLARKGKFDIVVSSGGNKFISILLWLTGIKSRYGYDTGALSRKLLTKAVPLNKNQYACAMYHDLVTPLTDYKTELPEVNITPQPKRPDTVLIHPGVSKISVQKGCIKTVGAEIWAQVVELLVQKGKHVILAGGPDDKECIETILNTITCKDSVNFENYYGKTRSMKELGELISSAEKFLCSDSAPLHVAVALKTKTYVIFGPTDDKKLIPQSENVIAIKASDNCPLKPCLWERRLTTCEKLDCLKITPEYIAAKVME